MWSMLMASHRVALEFPQVAFMEKLTSSVGQHRGNARKGRALFLSYPCCGFEAHDNVG